MYCFICILFIVFFFEIKFNVIDNLTSQNHVTRNMLEICLLLSSSWALYENTYKYKDV